MLHFSGTVFDTPSILSASYKAFLPADLHSHTFFALNSIPDGEICFDSTEKKKIRIGQLCIVQDDGRCLVGNRGHYCLVNADFSQISLTESLLHPSSSAFQSINETLHQLARFRALFLNMLVLHASAVVHRDEVLLFSGTSGAGKSTQANLWVKHAGAWVLNYDKPIVKIEEDGVLVSGSPWGGKEDLSINEVRPVKALFFVHQAKENRLVRLSSAMAYSRMYLNYFVYPLTREIEELYSDTLVRIIRRIPVYDLYCTDTEDAVRCVQDGLYPSEV